MFELSAGLYVLVGVSFLTSLMTAAIGVGGGIGLLAVMPQFLPISAVVPVHGLIQMVSNGSRFAFDYKHAKIEILPRYVIGCLSGAAIGYFFIGHFPEKYLSLILGIFIWRLLDQAGRLARLCPEKLCHRWLPANVSITVRCRHRAYFPADPDEDEHQQGSGHRHPRHADECIARPESSCLCLCRLCLHGLCPVDHHHDHRLHRRFLRAAFFEIEYRNVLAPSCLKPG